MLFPVVIYVIRQIYVELRDSTLDYFKMIQYLLLLVVFTIDLGVELMCVISIETLIVAKKFQYLTTFNTLTFEIASQM